MIFPAITARMEQRRDAFRCRVQGFGYVLLSLVTIATRERKIVQVVRAAFDTRQDMIYREPPGVELLRVAAILADTSSLSDDLSADRFRDDCHTSLFRPNAKFRHHLAHRNAAPSREFGDDFKAFGILVVALFEEGKQPLPV